MEKLPSRAGVGVDVGARGQVALDSAHLEIHPNLVREAGQWTPERRDANNQNSQLPPSGSQD
jgi:hypothetical protein